MQFGMVGPIIFLVICIMEQDCLLHHSGQIVDIDNENKWLCVNFWEKRMSENTVNPKS